MKFLGVLLQKAVTFLHCLRQECEKPSTSVYSKAEMQEILQLFKENVLKVQNNQVTSYLMENYPCKMNNSIQCICNSIFRFEKLFHICNRILRFESHNVYIFGGEGGICIHNHKIKIIFNKCFNF